MNVKNNQYDFIVIGAGIVGMSVAYALLMRNPGAKIAILEKEAEIGKHASGRNSGVLHCGIYYQEDSIKAKVCAQGSAKMLEFAKEYKIPYTIGGKVIVPTHENHFKTLDNLLQNAINNGVSATRIDGKQLLELEPYAFPAEQAIYCPSTAMIDNKAVLQKLKTILIQGQVNFIFDCKVNGIRSLTKKVVSTQGDLSYSYLFNCAGAYADRLARTEGLGQAYTLLPFKGIYYKLSLNASAKVRANIYPVPNVSTPFLGVHLTRCLDGNVYAGPTAIPVFGRENYSGFQGIKLQESFELIAQIGRLMWRNEHDFRRLAKTELLKYHKNIFFQDVKKLMPSLTIDDLIPSAKAGIRPQLMNKQSKALEMDYIFEQSPSSIHVLNAISPAFTSSFAFAELILQQAKLN
jgi:L-2-hydroxyglutarate oxidase